MHIFPQVSLSSSASRKWHCSFFWRGEVQGWVTAAFFQNFTKITRKSVRCSSLSEWQEGNGVGKCVTCTKVGKEESAAIIYYLNDGEVFCLCLSISPTHTPFPPSLDFSTTEVPCSFLVCTHTPPSFFDVIIFPGGQPHTHKKKVSSNLTLLLVVCVFCALMCDVVSHCYLFIGHLVVTIENLKTSQEIACKRKGGVFAFFFPNFRPDVPST